MGNIFCRLLAGPIYFLAFVFHLLCALFTCVAQRISGDDYDTRRYGHPLILLGLLCTIVLTAIAFPNITTALPVIPSFFLAAASMIFAAVYLYRSARFQIRTTTLLLGFLLVFYGPAYLVYMLYYNVNSVIYRELIKSPYFDEGVVSLNVALAIMYLCSVLGIEIAEKIASTRSRKLKLVMNDWSTTPIAGNPHVVGVLIVLNLAICFFMIGISLYENHLGIILGFLKASSSATAKDEYRLLFSGSPVYLYRILVSSLAPFLIIWGILEAWVGRSRLLMAASVLLLLSTLLGRVETLSRAPVAFFVLQFALAGTLCFRNKMTWKFVAFGSLIAIAIFLPLIQLTIPEMNAGTGVEFFFRRAFLISDETLLEFFAAYPHYISHAWGKNIRLIAFLEGVEFRPAYSDVAYLWRGQSGSTSNAMFIADAWADFSFFGVAFLSILVGMVSGAIDLTILSERKSAMSVAVLACMFTGILGLMTGSAQAAMLSGGLLSVPILALTVTGLTSLFGNRREGLQPKASTGDGA